MVQSGFSDGPVVKTQHFQCKGHGFIPGRGTRILNAAWCSRKKKKKKVQPMRKQYGVPQDTELPLNPAILDIYSKRIEISGSDIYIPILRELYTISTLTNRRKPPKCSSINEWINKT